MTKNFYDLDQVRSLSILEVAELCGIDVKRVGRSYWCKLRSEKTASTKLFLDNPSGYHSFFDFGVNEGGDVIAFASKAMSVEWQNALEFLAESFYIEPINNIEYQNRNELTDYQYEKIGIQGDLATKNLDFDLEKYSMESAQKFSDKYHMTVNKLRTTYPEFYTYKILMGKAIPFVSNLRNEYYAKLYNHYLLAKSLNVTNPTELSDSSLSKFEKFRVELTNAEKLLHKAAKGTSMEERLPLKQYDVRTDYQALIEGVVSFQIGDISYNDIKQQARQQDVVVHYRSVMLDDYLSLRREGITDVPHAAFVRGDKVNLVFLPEHSISIENFIESHQVKKEIDKVVAARGNNDLHDNKHVRENLETTR